jgi:hypothetical protein
MILERTEKWHDTGDDLGLTAGMKQKRAGMRKKRTDYWLDTGEH